MEGNVDFHKRFSWLRKADVSGPDSGESYQQRLTRLEGDKESLVLQLSVLTDQVEAQGEKIRDLESSLGEYQHKLYSTEETLHQELLNRSCLQAQKRGLLEEVSCLKLKLRDMENKESNGAERQHKAESVVNLISELQEQMCQIRQEISRKKPAEMILEGSKGLESEQSTAAEPKAAKLLQELRTLKHRVGELEQEKSHYEQKLKVTQAELTTLQQLLDCKNCEIDTLQAQLLSRAPVAVDAAEREEIYRRRLNTKHQELLRLKTGMESLIAANDEKDRQIEELTFLLRQFTQMREFMDLFQGSKGRWFELSGEDLKQNASVKTKTAAQRAHPGVSAGDLTLSHSSPLLLSSVSSLSDTHSRFLSEEDLKGSSSPKVEQDDRRLAKLPGEVQPEMKEESEQKTQDEDPRAAEKSNDSCSSDHSSLSSGAESLQQSPVSQENSRNGNIRKLFGRMRRTGLTEDLEPGPFRRGGFRATAGPRLTRTPDPAPCASSHTAFSKWTTEQVCSWMEDCGLGQYVSLARQWVDSGQTLLSATPQELEKGICIKHPLHRKKLQLALRGFSSKTMEKSSELDHVWVTRWLDDIGLPQYKEQFYDSRVDGRMLQHLTVNDLLFLKVTSQLHHLSIKCAIHVLHVNQFNPHCLRRRPGDEMSPSEVVQWSNHRVMEWLRSADLAEYAPNLRGSGVHGGLIILEPRFRAETLALLLNIPPQKTLLRRHLATNFSALVGLQAQQEKREYANANGHAPLTTTAKVRPKKLGFTHFRQLRKLRMDDSADYICPMDTVTPPPPRGTATRPYSSGRGVSPILDRDSDRTEQTGSKG